MKSGAMGIAEYRAKAAELRNEAKRVTHADVKEQLLVMAADWDTLANDADELERRRQAAGDAASDPVSG